MKIIISPAKKMRENTDILEVNSTPVFLEKTKLIMECFKGLSFQEAKNIWKCNDNIAKLNYDRFKDMDLEKGLTPAILAYEGIQYQHMAPQVFDNEQWKYIQEHIYILSGFYGVLKPFDGVVPYRLEMQAKLSIGDYNSLYEFWGESLWKEIKNETDSIINLSSKEYGKCIEKYLDTKTKFVNCIFGEYKEGKVIEKGTQVKMARGEMVRYMAENFIEYPDDLKSFNRLGYKFDERVSNEYNFVFVKGEC